MLPVDVGVDEVLRGHVEERRRRAEGGEILRGVHREESGCRRPGLQGGPLQAHRVLARRAGRRVDTTMPLGAGVRVVGDRREVRREPRDDRAVDGGADRQLDGIAARDLDRLGALVERHQDAVAPVLVALDLLEVEVGDVGREVGEAPRDLVVVADDDAGHAREAEAGDVERARVAHRARSAVRSGARRSADPLRGADRSRGAASRTRSARPRRPTSSIRCPRPTSPTSADTASTTLPTSLPLDGRGHGGGRGIRHHRRADGLSPRSRSR